MTSEVEDDQQRGGVTFDDRVEVETYDQPLALTNQPWEDLPQAGNIGRSEARQAYMPWWKRQQVNGKGKGDGQHQKGKGKGNGPRTVVNRPPGGYWGQGRGRRSWSKGKGKGAAAKH